VPPARQDELAILGGRFSGAARGRQLDPDAAIRPFFNPATGEWTAFTAVAEDSDGQVIQFSWRSVPQATG
jgi:hypothetical protein